MLSFNNICCKYPTVVARSSFQEKMKNKYRFVRKSYAMSRMARAIERAIEATTIRDKDRAARWAAAWGLLCGVHTKRVKLRRNDLIHVAVDKKPAQDLASLEFPEIVFSASTTSSSPGNQVPAVQASLLATHDSNCVTAGIFDPSIRA